MSLRRYGTSIPVDWVVINGGGAKSVSLTPSGSAQQVSFGLPATAKLAPNGHYACAPGKWFELVTTFDQAAAGGAAVNADQLPVIIKSIREYNPDVWGVVRDENVWTGPVAKNVIEKVANGYRGAYLDRAQISSADGDTVVTLYWFLPDVNENFEDGPEQDYRWIGWDKNTQITITLDANTAIAAASTGAVVKTSATFRMWQNTYSLRRPPLPAMNIWKRYLSPAVAAGNTITLRNFGDPGSFKNGSKQVRILFLAELMNVLGLPGISTADTITSYECDIFNQLRIDNVISLMMEFRRMIGHQAGSANQHDGAGFPHTMAATPNGDMKAATLMFLALRYPSTLQRVQNLMRWPVPADLEYKREQPSGGPSSGNHFVLSCERHETDDAGQAILRRMAGISPAVQTPSVNPRFAQLTPNQRFGSGKVFAV